MKFKSIYEEKLPEEILSAKEEVREARSKLKEKQNEYRRLYCAWHQRLRRTEEFKKRNQTKED